MSCPRRLLRRDQPGRHPPLALEPPRVDIFELRAGQSFIAQGDGLGGAPAAAQQPAQRLPRRREFNGVADELDRLRAVPSSKLDPSSGFMD